VAASRFQVSLKRQLTHRDLLPASQYLQTAGASDRLPISVVRGSGEVDDSLLVRYSPLSVAGLYHLTVMLDGQHIRRSPLALSVVPGATALLCHAAAPSRELCAGGEALLMLHACDRLGNRCTAGGDSLEVQLQDAEQAQVDCSVLDLRNGAYELRATAVGAGSYIGRVLLRSVGAAGGGGKAADGGGGKATGAWSTPSGGEHTQPPASPPPAASPPLAFELCVLPHTSHAAACLVEQLPRKGRELAARPAHGSLPAHLTVDEAVRLRLTVRDKFGNRRSSGGDGWTISLDEVSEGAPRPPPLPGSNAAQPEPWVWACEVQPSPLSPSFRLCTPSAPHLLCPLCTLSERAYAASLQPIYTLSAPSASSPQDQQDGTHFARLTCHRAGTFCVRVWLHPKVTDGGGGSGGSGGGGGGNGGSVSGGGSNGGVFLSAAAAAASGAYGCGGGGGHAAPFVAAPFGKRRGGWREVTSWRVEVAPAAPSAPHCITSGEALCHATAGDAAAFALELRDARGNACVDYPPSDVARYLSLHVHPVQPGHDAQPYPLQPRTPAAAVGRPSPLIHVTTAVAPTATTWISGEARATVQVAHAPEEAGRFQLSVHFAGDGVAGSPFALLVVPNEVSPAHCVLLTGHAADHIVHRSRDQPAAQSGAPHPSLPTNLVAGQEWVAQLLLRDCGRNLIAARPEHQLCGAFARVEDDEAPHRASAAAAAAARPTSPRRAASPTRAVPVAAGRGFVHFGDGGSPPLPTERGTWHHHSGNYLGAVDEARSEAVKHTHRRAWGGGMLSTHADSRARTPPQRAVSPAGVRAATARRLARGMCSGDGGGSGGGSGGCSSRSGGFGSGNGNGGGTGYGSGTRSGTDSGFADGGGLSGGSAAEGRRVRRGGMAVPARFHGGGKDGRCTVHAQLCAAGDYRLVVSVLGQPVPSSRCWVRVVPGAVSAAHSGLFPGTAVDGSVVRAAEEACFGVVARDDQGNVVPAPPPHVDCKVAPHRAGHCSVEMHDDGCAMVRLMPERVGELLLHVRMGGQPVMGSPFAVRVVAGQVQLHGCP